MTESMPSVDIVVPVYNEEADLDRSVRRLLEHLQGISGYSWRIIVADNGSTDKTPEVAQSLSNEFEEVKVVRIAEKGRGRALRQVWTASEADIVCYTDVDLSTGLEFLGELVGCLTRGYDVSTGSRLMHSSDVTRSVFRETLSRGYNLLIQIVLGVKFHDAQCGFKAATREFVRDVAPRVVANGWFFDTEMLVLAEKNGYRIKEIPVKWVEDPNSTVRVVSTVWGQLKGMLRLRFSRLRFR